MREKASTMALRSPFIILLLLASFSFFFVAEGLHHHHGSSLGLGRTCFGNGDGDHGAVPFKFDLKEKEKLRCVAVTYNNTSAGHREFGYAIAAAFRKDIQKIFYSDKELERLVEWCNGKGSLIFDRLVSAARSAYPMLFEEVEGMALGADVPLSTMLVNQFREELVQLVPSTVEKNVRGRGLCSSILVNQKDSQLLAHNDDWTQDWRDLAYWVVGTEVSPNPSVKSLDVSFGTWVYPGYLSGMDISWNTNGIMYTVNSLFPLRKPDPDGVGTAFIARDMLVARSVEDCERRAQGQPTTPASAMSYQIASFKDKRVSGTVFVLAKGTFFLTRLLFFCR